jgi:hypothetical protein
MTTFDMLLCCIKTDWAAFAEDQYVIREAAFTFDILQIHIIIDRCQPFLKGAASSYIFSISCSDKISSGKSLGEK